MIMRRILCVLLILLTAVMPVSAKNQNQYVVLSFDDGPSGKYTRALLDGLAQREVTATFLLCGYRIQQYPQETQRILDEGHEIGCHGFSHKNMQAMGRREIAQEITDTLDLLPQQARVRFLRPPGGCCSEAVRQVAEARQLSILSWSIDPRDWAVKDAAAVEEAVVSQVKDGDIILLHDMSESSVQAALAIVDDLKARGFTFVTASRLAVIREQNLKAGKSYASFPG